MKARNVCYWFLAICFAGFIFAAFVRPVLFGKKPKPTVAVVEASATSDSAPTLLYLPTPEYGKRANHSLTIGPNTIVTVGSNYDLFVKGIGGTIRLSGQHIHLVVKNQGMAVDGESIRVEFRDGNSESVPPDRESTFDQ